MKKATTRTRFIMRNGEPQAALADAASAWMAGYENDPTFADDIERVGAADRPPKNPWDS